MVFSSLVFLLVFLTVVLIANYFLPMRFKNIFLLLANLIFYAYGEPVYVLLMIASVVVNYLAAKSIEKTVSEAKRRAILILCVVLNLGALAFFKYTSFFADTLRLIPAFSALPKFSVRLPIGISFYTFQAMSYCIDVYTGECRSARSFVDFAAYISLFPQLIAGPIVRYCDVDRQLGERRTSVEMLGTGIRLFSIGLAKKVLLANQFGIVWDSVSANVSAFGTLGAWAGAVAYAMHIYFDFAGYSDMARGLGKMLGFDFCINFNYPYISKSVTEFWRRWHISLSTWFRDYLYIPLGGNRLGKGRMCFNILIVWGLTGLWHGAGWNFIAWGLYYGIILLAEKLLYGEKLAKSPTFVGHIYTLLIVIVGWIFFASESFTAAFEYLKVMFVPTPGNARPLIGRAFTLAVGAVGSTPLACRLWNAAKSKRRLTAAETALCAASLLLCIASLVTDSYNPFLYFRF